MEQSVEEELPSPLSFPAPLCCYGPRQHLSAVARVDVQWGGFSMDDSAVVLAERGWCEQRLHAMREV